MVGNTKASHVGRVLRRALACSTLAASALLFAQHTSAQPIGSGEEPDQSAASALNKPVGPPRYDPALPKGTPGAIRAVDPTVPVSTLSDALERAYWSSPSLLAERARLRSTDYRLPQARSQYGPRLDYVASYGFQRDNTEILPDTFRPRSGWSSAVSAVLTQPVYTFGRNAAGERGALAQIAFERAVLRQAEGQALFDALAAYAGVLRDRAAVGIARDNLDLLEREYADSKSRLDVREITLTDYQQVATRVELGRAQLLAAQRVAASSEAQFVSTVGAPAATELKDPNPLIIPARTLEDVFAYSDLRNPVIGAAYAREQSSRAAKQAARADMMPRVDLRGRANYGSVTPYTDRLRQTELRGEVVVSGNLFQSGQGLARIGEADAANDADWRLIDQAQRESRVELADAWNQWLALSASTGYLAKAVEEAQAAYDGAILQERAGMRTTLDVLDLARELLSARTNYNGATSGAYLAQARLLLAMGALEQSYLFPDAPRYDAEAHFEKVKNNGDIPLVTPLLRMIDGTVLGGRKDRALRDPSAKVTAPGVDLPVPAPPSALSN
jgi:outer membrane protein